MSNIYKILLLSSLLFLANCSKLSADELNFSLVSPKPQPMPEKIEKIGNDAKGIHMLVALWDNENQGIVPVPKHLGNGEDPKRNLYWEAAYGVKTFFSRSNSRQKLAEIKNPKENILERIIFKHRQKNVYLVADAYRGINIKDTITDFMLATSGEKLENIRVGDKTLQIVGSANIISFVGHNGLMDFDLDKRIVKKDNENRKAIVLACLSKKYFSEYLKQTSAKPLLWTTNFMAPEAYILHGALEGWINNESDAQTRTRAAKAYAKYQKISLRSAKRLLITGW